jgi:hypothetical protein
MKIYKPVMFYSCAFIFLLICFNELFFAFMGIKPGNNLSGGIGASGLVMLGIWAALGKSKTFGFISGIVIYVLVCFLSAFVYGHFK